MASFIEGARDESMTPVPTYPPAVTPTAWNQMATYFNALDALGLDWPTVFAYLTGLTASGIVASQETWLIRKNGVVYEAIDNAGHLDYGGAGDAGGADGDDANEVIQACLTDGLVLGDVHLKIGPGTFPEINLSINPALTRSVIIEGSGAGLVTGTVLQLKANAYGIYVPNTAAVNCNFVFRDFTISTDHTTFATVALFIDQHCQIDFRDLSIINSLAEDVPLASSVGLQLGTSVHVLSADMKILDNIIIAGYEIGANIAADWVDLRSVCVWHSNTAAFAFYGLPLKPRMERCHAYDCGGPHIILDQRGGGGEGYNLDIDNFDFEGGPPAGFHAIDYIFYQATQTYFSVQNFVTYTGFGLANPPEYGGTTGALRLSHGAPVGAVMPSDVVHNWLRYAWDSTPAFIANHNFRNRNMATLHIKTVVDLTGGGADATAYLIMGDLDPETATRYAVSYAYAKVMASAYDINSTQTLELDVPPGWWFALVTSNAALYGYDVSYRNFNPT